MDRENTGYENRMSRIRSMELTNREKDILHLMARCYTYEEMVPILNISIRTIEKHVENISLKIGFRTYIRIARYAIENGYGKQEVPA